ncbi:MAG: hypothetical protein HY270_01945 [Deltaproteobacteria bacterium]|nr:hypothetical protein [Deltaproteobacteria bacterium]
MLRTGESVESIGQASCNRRWVRNTAWLGAAALLLLARGAISTASAQGPPPPPPPPANNISGFGMPFAELLQSQNAADLQLFANGQASFIQVEELPRVGPIFNSRSCGSCHFQPALGGSGAFINEVRVRNNTAGGPLHIFASDNMLRGGPQQQGPFTVFENGLTATPIGCQITSPRCAKSRCQREEMRRTTFSPRLPICDPTSPSFQAGANCVGERQSAPLFGLGLVEAVADADIEAIAAAQPVAIRGVAKQVNELGSTRVARFGWKADHATLRAFSGDAYLNEMGITNPDFSQERSTCALNVTKFGVLLDAGDDPEDAPGPDGRGDVDRFTDFMRALDAPPRIAENTSAQAGHSLFNSIGCGGCHTETLTTSANPAAFVPASTGGTPLTATMNALLTQRTFHPFSDFLVHDIGSLGDGITSDAAGPTMMRTTPLWGLRGKSVFLHDGRASELVDAIRLHAGQGGPAASAFRQLSPPQQRQVLDFLNTL